MLSFKYDKIDGLGTTFYECFYFIVSRFSTLLRAAIYDYGTPRRSFNLFLCEAMLNLNSISTYVFHDSSLE